VENDVVVVVVTDVRAVLVLLTTMVCVGAVDVRVTVAEDCVKAAEQYERPSDGVPQIARKPLLAAPGHIIRN
jgi:hypothetical protein